MTDVRAGYDSTSTRLPSDGRSLTERESGLGKRCAWPMEAWPRPAAVRSTGPSAELYGSSIFDKIWRQLHATATEAYAHHSDCPFVGHQLPAVPPYHVNHASTHPSASSSACAIPHSADCLHVLIYSFARANMLISHGTRPTYENVLGF